MFRLQHSSNNMKKKANRNQNPNQDQGQITKCAQCKKKIQEGDEFVKCSDCNNISYCSRDCQRQHFMNHSPNCVPAPTRGSTSGSASASGNDNNSSNSNNNNNNNNSRRYKKHTSAYSKIKDMFQLDNMLHDMPEKKVYEFLIDSFRMRVEDAYNFGQKNIGLYAQEDPLPEFKKFLDYAEKRKDLLPPWWDQHKRQLCIRQALDRENWSCIYFAVEKDDIIEHYANNMAPMKLQILAERVHGKGVPGTVF